MELRSSSFRGKDFKFQCDPEDHSSHWTFEDERGVRDELWDVHEGDIILDVGAAFGSYALSALAVGASFVHSWSMETHHQIMMEESLKANRWEKRCTVNRFGLFHRPGWYRWQDRRFSETPEEGFVVVDSIDHMMEDPELFPYGPRYFIKIDTEGAEPEILKGAEKFLEVHRPNILVENHDFLRPHATSLVREYLAEQGFELSVDRPSAMCSHSLYLPD
jgi:FkbM family methyltransferase